MTSTLHKTLKSLPDQAQSKSLPAARNERWTPFFYGGALIAVGALLLKTKPRFGQTPNAVVNGDIKSKRKRRQMAKIARDGAMSFAPSNVTDQVGKSLVMGGAALLVTRLFDEIAGRDD